MSILEDLEKIMLTEIAVGLGKKTIGPDEDLLEQGIIDSLGLMKLIDIMEKTFGISISDEEIAPDNFQTLTSMVKLVERHRQIN
jgi:acyl carrier protein